MDWKKTLAQVSSMKFCSQDFVIRTQGLLASRETGTVNVTGEIALL